MSTLRRTLLLGTALMLAACEHAHASETKHSPAAESSAHAAPSGSASTHVLHEGHGGGHDAHGPAPMHGSDAPKLPVPFIGEAGSLDVAKSFLHAMLSDNGAFVSANGPTHFQPFAASQKPRATVLACSDSRVQANAFDKSPENDLFTIRNIGNQLRTSEGSVEYGVDHLSTSVLLVLGHSGCGAVKAAMGPHDNLPDAIRQEVDGIVVPPKRPGVSEAEALTDAVVSNVHDQVRAALVRFSDRVRDGRLTVVGAVYDFRDDLKQGFGRVVIVDVNGNSDPAALSSFTKAVERL